jgi:hypothetical protein
MPSGRPLAHSAAISFFTCDHASVVSSTTIVAAAVDASSTLS